VEVSKTPLPEVLLIKPKVFGDTRGFFMQTWQQKQYAENGIAEQFVQDNLSYSAYGVLRGLHLQKTPHAQGKLVSVLQGEVFDVAVDVRPDSPHFGEWTGVYLSAENKHQFYVPAGFAHGFCVTSETALFAYKCTEYYHPEAEISLRWNDSDIAIQWPVKEPQLAEKDSQALTLSELRKLMESER
jgi:dTDP-4-dehydrorhamnose 3,5-epimerase